MSCRSGRGELGQIGPRGKMILRVEDLDGNDTALRVEIQDDPRPHPLALAHGGVGEAQIQGIRLRILPDFHVFASSREPGGA